MFMTTGPHFCPTCPPVMRIRRPTKGNPSPEPIQVGERLELSEADYSGSGFDMANCTNCGRGFCISYMVKAIERAPDWDAEGVESGISVTSGG